MIRDSITGSNEPTKPSPRIVRDETPYDDRPNNLVTHTEENSSWWPLILGLAVGVLIGWTIIHVIIPTIKNKVSPPSHIIFKAD